MITSAIMMERPSVRPSGKPSLSTPIMMDTTAAPQRITLIGSLKFSMISSHRVLITGGGKAFVPCSYILFCIDFGSIPRSASDSRPAMMLSTPPNCWIINLLQSLGVVPSVCQLSKADRFLRFLVVQPPFRVPPLLEPSPPSQPFSQSSNGS